MAYNLPSIDRVVTYTSGPQTLEWGGTYLIDTTAAGVDVNLESAANNAGASITVIKIDGTTNLLLINAAAGETINGSSAGIERQQRFTAITFRSDGANVVVASDVIYEFNPTSTKTANYNANQLETVLVDPTGGPFTVFLPSVSTSGQHHPVRLKNVTASTNAVTVNPGGGVTIDGAATLTLSEPYQAITLMPINPTEWARMDNIPAGSGGGWVDLGTTVALASPTDSVGIGTSSPASGLEINKSLLFNTGHLPNFPTGGTISALTVDFLTSVDINQTTANQTIAVAAPTNPVAGRILYVNNVGTARFTMFSIPVAPNTGIELVWDGTSWNPTSAPANIGWRYTPSNLTVSLDDDSMFVGIGTSNPTSKLSVIRTVDAADGLIASRNLSAGASAAAKNTISSNTGVLDLTTYSSAFSGFAEAQNSSSISASASVATANLFLAAKSDMMFWTGGTPVAGGTPANERIRIKADGKIGLHVSAPAADVHIGKSLLLGMTAIANLPTGGAIGSAAATVDVSSSFSVNQTTAGQSISLPTPTNATAGRFAYVTNIGTAAFSLLAISVPPGAALIAIWNGTTWVAAGDGSSSVAPAGWQLTGNAVSAGQFLGSTNNANVVFTRFASAAPDSQTNVQLTVEGLKIIETTTGTARFLQFNVKDNPTRNVGIGGPLTGAGNYGLRLPPTQGSSGQVLSTDGASTANLNWITIPTPTPSGWTDDGTAVRLTTATDNVGIGVALPSAGLEISKSTLFSTAFLADFPTGGSIGPASATVDLFTAFDIVQNTAGQTLSLPNPTNVAPGRIVYVSNRGTATFTMLGMAVDPNRTLFAFWHGTAWTLAGDGSGTSSPSGWTDDGTVVRLTTATDSVGVGTASPGAVFHVTQSATNANATAIIANTSADGNAAGVAEIRSNDRTLSLRSYGSTAGPLASLAAVLNNNGQLNLVGSAGVSIFADTNPLTVTNGLNVSPSNNVGIGTYFPVTGLHIEKSTLFSTLNIPNLPTGGAIGLAGATVDVATSARIAQTTAGQTVTVPSPTDATPGRLFYLANTGSASFTIAGGTLSPGQAIALVWNGTAWVSASGTGAVGTPAGWTDDGSIVRLTTFTDSVGIGTATPNSGLEISKSVLFDTSHFLNFPTGGPIPAGTIDLLTSVDVNQTTAGQTITLDPPTNTTAGRLLYVSNVGSASFTMLGTSVAPGSSIVAMWNGTSWSLASGAGSTASGWTDDGTTVRLTTITDNVGIGTASPTAKLHVEDSTNTINQMVLARNPNAGAAAAARIGVQSDAGGVILSAYSSTFPGDLQGAAEVSASGPFQSLQISSANHVLVVPDNNVGVKTFAPVSGLHVNASLLLQAVALGNFATGGSVGTAAATVDIASTLTINQTTAGQTLTLPSPTQAAAGRVLYVTNIGSASFTMLGRSLGTSETLSAFWSGTAWTLAGDGSTPSPSGWTDDGATVRLTTITDSVGIGTVTPAAKVNIVNPDNTTVDLLTVENTNTGNTASAKFTVAADQSFVLVQTMSSGFTGALQNSATILGQSIAKPFFIGGVNGLSFTTSSTIDNTTTRLAITAAGDVGIGTVTPSAGLHVAPAMLMEAIALPDFPAGGIIGSAASTVNVKSHFTINQTTAGQTLTLPTPTGGVTGRLAYVSNIGTASFTMLGRTVAAGQTLFAVWNGLAWGLAGDGASTGGTGDVVGPASSIDNRIARFDGATGKIIQSNPGAQVNDEGGIGIQTTGSTAGLAVLTLNSAANAAIFEGNSTNAHVVSVTGDSLTLSNALRVSSNSGDSGNRAVAFIQNFNSGATGARVLELVQNANQVSLNLTGSAGATIQFQEFADHAGANPTAGLAKLWVRSDTPNKLIFTDDTGVDTVLGAGAVTDGDKGDIVVSGGGNVWTVEPLFQRLFTHTLGIDTIDPSSAAIGSPFPAVAWHVIYADFSTFAGTAYVNLPDPTLAANSGASIIVKIRNPQGASNVSISCPGGHFVDFVAGGPFVLSGAAKNSVTFIAVGSSNNWIAV